MIRHTVIPPTKSAVRKADHEFYLKNPGMVKNKKRIPLERNNVAQWRLREQWMDMYVAKGGAIENVKPDSQKPDEIFGACPFSSDALSGNLSVHVIDDNDDSSIPGATVAIQGIGEKNTDANGLASFDCVDSGVYDLAVVKAGYIPIPGYEKVEVIAEATSLGEVRLQLILEGVYSTEKSFSFSSGAGTDDKVVFLTFDDGVWDGTREVFDLLKSLDVPATFFVVGEHVTASLSRYPGLFQEMYNDPKIQICNHSHTHTHQFYEGYYESGGLKLDSVTLEPDSVAATPVRRSVLMDFEYANLAFTEALSHRRIRRPTDPRYDAHGLLDTTKLQAYSRFLSARLPSMNIWRLPSVRADIGTKTSTAADEALDLETNGYKLYGWDLEWKFEPKRLVHIMQGEFDAHRTGYLDLYSAAYIDLDRPIQTVDEVFDATKSAFGAFAFGRPKSSNKVILLMHDREFRRYKAGSESLYLDQLKDYIERCKKEGYKFDVVGHY